MGAAQVTQLGRSCTHTSGGGVQPHDFHGSEGDRAPKSPPGTRSASPIKSSLSSRKSPGKSCSPTLQIGKQRRSHPGTAQGHQRAGRDEGMGPTAGTCAQPCPEKPGQSSGGHTGRELLPAGTAPRTQSRQPFRE